MLVSRSIPLFRAQVPSYKGEIKMLPFFLNDISNIPGLFKDLVYQMIEELPVITIGEAYLTVDGKVITPGTTHRRGGPHIDGNYLPNLTKGMLGWGAEPPGWGQPPAEQPAPGWTSLPNIGGWGASDGGKGGGNGWKVGEGGVELTSEGHRQSYQSRDGGMLMVSDHPGCRGWNGLYPGDAGVGGDCSHMRLGDGFILQRNIVYYGSSQFIHESIPHEEEVHRTMVRITLPTDYPLLGTGI